MKKLVKENGKFFLLEFERDEPERIKKIVKKLKIIEEFKKIKGFKFGKFFGDGFNFMVNDKKFKIIDAPGVYYPDTDKKRQPMMYLYSGQTTFNVRLRAKGDDLEVDDKTKKIAYKMLIEKLKEIIDGKASDTARTVVNLN